MSGDAKVHLATITRRLIGRVVLRAGLRALSGSNHYDVVELQGYCLPREGGRVVVYIIKATYNLCSEPRLMGLFNGSAIKGMAAPPASALIGSRPEVKLRLQEER